MDDDGGVQFWQQYQQWEEEENERLSGNQCGAKGTDEDRDSERPDGATEGELSNFAESTTYITHLAPLLASERSLHLCR